MFHDKTFRKESEDTLCLQIPTDRDYRILQLTDLHLGYGRFSRTKDANALKSIGDVIKKANPDLIVITGDMVFPLFFISGTGNNEKQAKKLTAFLDTFEIPYTFVFGNHDCEIGSKLGKPQLAKVLSQGKYCMFLPGEKTLTGVGNFFLHLTDGTGKVLLPLALLDSNMYVDKWFFHGFIGIQADQTKWCMAHLEKLKREQPKLYALAFFHMPLWEFKEAYEKRKLGDDSIRYHFGSVGEKEDYFGISIDRSPFFDEAVKNGVIKGMFCGHDHYNSISLTYKNIRLTYGMSIDWLGYHGISKRHIQRGGTLITRHTDGNFSVSMVPLNRVVATRIRGKKNERN